MTRQCTCGGIVRQHELTGDREAWTCNACGRYGAIRRIAQEAGISEESVELFTAISESDGFTAEAAYKAFAHLGRGTDDERKAR